MNEIPRPIQAYLEAIAQLAGAEGNGLASVILFGSASTGGFSAPVSDVDLILVLRDDASQEARQRWIDEVAQVEARHGLREERTRPRRPLETLMDRATANERSFFVCTRSDLLSGDVSRILGLPQAQAQFVDRTVLPSIVASAVTVWGEELLPHIPLPPIRRIDVLKSFHGLFGQVLLSFVLFPVLADATRYAMGALKRGVHNCYFCHNARAAPLEDEIDFFQRRWGPNRTLSQLVVLRSRYEPSFSFVTRCLATLALLHYRTVKDNRFPRMPRAT